MQAESQVVHTYLLRYSKQHEQYKEEKKLPHRFRNMSECESESGSSNMAPNYYNIPIVGYEIVEQRERFTVYKIRVEKQPRSWFIFRRYTDFERLNEKLTSAFRTIRLKLPPKRRFGDNFNPDFIAKRAERLQNFIKTILQHDEMRNCHAVQEFFCFNDPPGPFDSLEESRAYVQYLEERLEDQRNVVKSLSCQLDATKSQLQQARVQIKSLECTMRNERKQHKPSHSTPDVINTSDSLSCPQIEAQLSDISDGCPASKPRKSVSFAMTKAASEGNLLLLKNARKKMTFPNLKDQTNFRHSITFGEDSFLYSGFLNVESHCNVTKRIKERKRKHRKQRAKSSEPTKGEYLADVSLSRSDPQNNDLTSRTKKEKKEKRDSGIIRDSFIAGTESDF